MAQSDDTRAKRFEYARLRAAIRLGRSALNPREMTEALIEAGAPRAAGNYYWRMETGRIGKVAPEWLDVIARVSGVDALWLSMVRGGERFAPEGYVEWLAAENWAAEPDREAMGEEGKAVRRRRGA